MFVSDAQKTIFALINVIYINIADTKSNNS